MKLGVSHLVFKDLPLEDILQKLEETPIQGIELAATLLWSDPIKSSSQSREEIKKLGYWVDDTSTGPIVKKTTYP